MVDDSTVFVGLDVHKDSITVASIGASPDETVVDIGTIGTQQYAVDRLLGQSGTDHGFVSVLCQKRPL